MPGVEGEGCVRIAGGKFVPLAMATFSGGKGKASRLHRPAHDGHDGTARIGNDGGASIAGDVGRSLMPRCAVGRKPCDGRIDVIDDDVADPTRYSRLEFALTRKKHVVGHLM